MFEVTKYPHGTFSWADCSSSHPDKSKQFYSAVMGWAIEDLPLGEGLSYTMLKCNDLKVAGLGPMMPGQDAMPSYWTSYVNVDDADAVRQQSERPGCYCHRRTNGHFRQWPYGDHPGPEYCFAILRLDFYDQQPHRSQPGQHLRRDFYRVRTDHPRIIISALQDI